MGEVIEVPELKGLDADDKLVLKTMEADILRAQIQVQQTQAAAKDAISRLDQFAKDLLEKYERSEGMDVVAGEVGVRCEAKMKIRELIVGKILDNLRGRKGFDEFWDQIDTEMQREIEQELVQVIQDLV